MTFYFFKSPSHIIHLITCICLCGIFVLTNIAAALFLSKVYARELHEKISQHIVRASFFALAMAIPVMPFIFGFQGFSSDKLTIFSVVYFIWQIIYLSAYVKIDWQRLIIPLALSALIGWVFMSLANYWLLKFIVSQLWLLFKAN